MKDDPALIEATARTIAEAMGDDPDDLVVAGVLPKSATGRHNITRARAAPAWTVYVAAAEKVLRYLLVERIVQVQRDTIDPKVKDGLLNEDTKRRFKRARVVDFAGNPTTEKHYPTLSDTLVSRIISEDDTLPSPEDEADRLIRNAERVYVNHDGAVAQAHAEATEILRHAHISDEDTALAQSNLVEPRTGETYVHIYVQGITTVIGMKGKSVECLHDGEKKNRLIPLNDFHRLFRRC